MSAERVLVTGITGQDGYYLTNILLGSGSIVYGLVRDPNRVESVKNLPKDVRLIKGDLEDLDGIVKVIDDGNFDYIYNLGGITNINDSWKDPAQTLRINGVTPCAIVNSVKKIGHGKVFLAASREIFGQPEITPQNEFTKIAPTNPYGSSKAMCVYTSRQYREKYSTFVSTGIFGNHESPRRGVEFVTRKVTIAAAAISLGLAGERSPKGIDGKPIVNNNLQMEIGDLGTIRDWGHANDFMQATFQLMQLDKPDDYVIATGKAHTIRELCKTAFESVGVTDWSRHIVVNPAWVNKNETVPLVGDYEKLRKATGWKPRITFEEMIGEMVQEDIKRLKV